MEDISNSEEASFVVEEVQTIIKESVENTLGNASYQHTKVPQWTNNIVEQCLKRLSSLNKPFKYVVTCIIMQKNGAGLHTATSCFWDTASDGIFKLNINIKQGAVLIDGSPEQCIVLQAFMD